MEGSPVGMPLAVEAGMLVGRRRAGKAEAVAEVSSLVAVEYRLVETMAAVAVRFVACNMNQNQFSLMLFMFKTKICGKCTYHGGNGGIILGGGGNGGLPIGIGGIGGGGKLPPP